MTAAMLLLITGGALALIVTLLVIVLVARSLDGSGKAAVSDDAQKKVAALFQSGQTAAQKLKSGAINEALAALSAQTGSETKPSQDGNTTIKQIITGLAIAGGLLALVMGIVAGDG